MTETIEQLKHRATESSQLSEATNERIDAINDVAWQLRLADTFLSTELSLHVQRLATRNDYWRGRAYALRNLGWCQMRVDQYEEGKQAFEVSHQIFLQIKDNHGLASAIVGLASTKRQAGDYEAALDYHRASLRLREKLNDSAGIASALIDSGITNWRLGNYAHSLDYSYRALQTALDCYSPIHQAHSYCELGNVLWRVGETAESIRCSEQALNLFVTLADRRNQSMALNNLAAVHHSHGDYRQALYNYQTALQLARQAQSVEAQAEAEIGIGNIYCETGAAGQGLAHLSDAVQLSDSIGSQFYASQALLSLGKAYQQAGARRESLPMLEQALAISQKLGAKDTAYKTHLALSEIYEAENKTAAALFHYQSFHRVWNEIYGTTAARQIERVLLSRQTERGGKLKLPLPQKLSESNQSNQSALTPRKLQQIKEFVAEHLGENITGADLAEVAGQSRAYFIRSFKQTVGKTPHQYLIEKRVEQAKKLIQTTNLPLSEIALWCGFSDQSHLTVQFRLVTGVTPKQFDRSQ